MAHAPFDLSGKLAIVTGGASGVGVGIAEMLAEAGAQLIIADRNGAGAEKQAKALRSAGFEAAAVEVDQTDEASVVRACADVVAKFGAPWALVNNAGLQDRETLLEGTTAHWDRIHAVNARGPFLMIREFGTAMAASGVGGRIVNIGSMAVRHPMITGLAAYAASKGALVTLSQSAAFELAPHGITVNTVLPHGVATAGAINATGPAPEGPGRRTGPFGLNEPRDIGAAVLFFVSPAAHRVTNQIIAVDAGFSIS